MRPLQAHCHRGLGILYAKTGQAEQARAALSAAIDAVPGHGHDLLAAPGGGDADTGGEVVRAYGHAGRGACLPGSTRRWNLLLKIPLSCPPCA